MKISMIDDNKIIVFLNTLKLKQINFEDKDNIEDNLRKIFLVLKYTYNLNIKGYYNVMIYLNYNEGAVLEIEHEDIDYFDYFDSKVDMRVNVIFNSNFLYRVNDILDVDKTILNKTKIYVFKNNYYLLLKGKLNFSEVGRLFEFSKLEYGSKVEDIIRLGNLVYI